MSVFVHACTGIYMYAYMYVKGRGYIQMQCVCMQIYVYISGFVRVRVCVYNYTCMYEETPCVHADVCIQIQAYMSVFVSCLQVVFWYIFTCLCAKSTHVCAYIYIYALVRVNEYIHVCLCACVYGCIYVFIYVCEGTLWVYTDAMCVHANIYTCLGLYVCVYLCTSIHICMKRHCVCMHSVCIQIQAYMSVFVSCLRMCFMCVCRY